MLLLFLRNLYLSFVPVESIRFRRSNLVLLHAIIFKVVKVTRTQPEGISTVESDEYPLAIEYHLSSVGGRTELQSIGKSSGHRYCLGDNSHSLYVESPSELTSHCSALNSGLL